MLSVLITKYFIALTIVTLLSFAETNAQLLNLNLLSHNNRGGQGPLNNNPAPRNPPAPPGPPVPASQAATTAAAQTTLNPFSSLSSALGAGLNFLAGSLTGRGFQPYYPYYSGYGTYTPYYFGGYPYYYYYYYG